MGSRCSPLTHTSCLASSLLALTESEAFASLGLQHNRFDQMSQAFYDSITCDYSPVSQTQMTFMSGHMYGEEPLTSLNEVNDTGVEYDLAVAMVCLYSEQDIILWTCTLVVH